MKIKLIFFSILVHYSCNMILVHYSCGHNTGALQLHYSCGHKGAKETDIYMYALTSFKIFTTKTNKEDQNTTDVRPIGYTLGY